MDQYIARNAAEAALDQLRLSLESDGFALTVEQTRDDGSVVICLEARPGACADCLVPDHILVSILSDALQKSMAGFTGVRLLRRGFENPHPREEAR